MKMIHTVYDKSSKNSEIEIMKSINHENIIKYFDSFDLEIQSEEYLCLITEYCEVFY